MTFENRSVRCAYGVLFFFLLLILSLSACNASNESTEPQPVAPTEKKTDGEIAPSTAEEQKTSSSTTCLGDADCLSGQVCDATAHQCVSAPSEPPPPPPPPPPSPEICSSDNDCTAGQVCQNGHCQDSGGDSATIDIKLNLDLTPPKIVWSVPMEGYTKGVAYDSNTDVSASSFGSTTCYIPFLTQPLAGGGYKMHESECRKPLNQEIYIKFSEPMNEASLLTNFEMKVYGILLLLPVEGHGAYDPQTRIFTFVPTHHDPGCYEFEMKSGAKDLAGNSLRQTYHVAYTTVGIDNCITPRTCIKNDAWSLSCPGEMEACTNGIKDEGETDVDCGGSCDAFNCKEGQACKNEHDCLTDNCVAGVCRMIKIFPLLPKIPLP